jgi:hypothetical protein
LWTLPPRVHPHEQCAVIISLAVTCYCLGRVDQRNKHFCSWSLVRKEIYTLMTSTKAFPAHPATASRDRALAAVCGLSTRGHWDGLWVLCNERSGVQSVMPHGERPHVNTLQAVALTFSGSARGCTVCAAQLPGGSSNSSPVMENTY